jgi:Na+-translocating ferredoxin:NAD+ oxidoreductase subunit G
VCERAKISCADCEYAVLISFRFGTKYRAGREMKTVFSCISLWACAAIVAIAAPALAIEYTTPQALLSQRFHASERVTFIKVRPDAAQRSALQARLGRALPKPEYTFFVATSHGQPDGYALFDDQLGQHEPISFATFFDAKGQITAVDVVAYREPFGDGIRAERFRKQFLGRTAQSQFRAGSDIDIIAGATISSRSMCVGVERAAALFAIAGPGNGATVPAR